MVIMSNVLFKSICFALHLKQIDLGMDFFNLNFLFKKKKKKKKSILKKIHRF